jgi:hypothetical protein
MKTQIVHSFHAQLNRGFCEVYGKDGSCNFTTKSSGKVCLEGYRED